MAIATPERWRFVRGHEKPRLMGVASHLLSRWYINHVINNYQAELVQDFLNTELHDSEMRQRQFEL